MKTIPPTPQSESPDLSRRRFLQASSVAFAGAALGQLGFAVTGRAAPEIKVRIGLIGCGGRGTGAVLDALGAATHVVYPESGYHTEDVAPGAELAHKGVEVIALADVFPDRLGACREQLKKIGVNFPDDRCFVGFEAYKQLLAVPDINYVILATPPHFRPEHLRASIEAGKHVFMEKPVAVDGPGVRMVLAAGEQAKQKGLGIAAGTQRRHSRSYPETIKRLHDGAIGEIMYGRVFWNGGVIWVIERQPGWSDMEWQLRNWNYFTWIGGDHIVEQHVHNLDVLNWVLRAHPIRAYGMGGRQARPSQTYGHIYDHFAVEFEYPDGIRVFSQCRQMNGCENKVEEHVVGTNGVSNCANWILPRDGRPWKFRDTDVNPYRQEHLNLIESIHLGQPRNEAQAIAEATLTGIMGRETCYAGRSIEWDEALNSTLRLGPTAYEFGELPFPEVPTPGKYQFA